MIKAHSLIYLAGRSVSGLLSFLTVSIYTRLLSPHEYGGYALIGASVAMMNMLFYFWQRVALIRFLPTRVGNPEPLYASSAIGYLGACLLTGLIVLPTIVLGQIQGLSITLVLTGLILLWSEALFELTLEFFRARLSPGKYAIYGTLKALLALSVGSLLVWQHLSILGVLLGLIAANIIILSLGARPFLIQLFASIRSFQPTVNKEFLKYGLPFTASFAFGCILNLSDRYFISYYIGKADTGYYSVGYELARQSIWVVMQAINLAFYPIIIRTLDQEGYVAANVKLEINFLLLIGVAAPIAFGISALADPISSLFVGPNYNNQVAHIIPLSALSAVVSGLYGFYFVQTFQLGRKTYLQFWPVAIAAAVHISLNFWWIPMYGTTGALSSTIVCDTLVLIISFFFSKGSYRMPIPWRKASLLIFAAGLMSQAVLYLKPYCPSQYQIPVMVLFGSFCYGTLLIVFRLLDWRIFTKTLSRKSI
ncbi:lipopolysaccharide biosynthesis protein [Spirosoma aerophilum]